MKTVELVVPCYNEEEGLAVFIRETTKVTETIEGYSFSFILVNDGSKDGTYTVMKNLAKQYSNVKYISFSRNFGKESAMYAGLKYSTADYVVVMDADLQHPPKMLIDMCKAMEEGYDCCAARRTTREGESKIRSLFSQSFYKISNKISDVQMPYGAVDYRMMTRQMVDSVVSLSEVQRFSKGLFCWVGYDTKWIPYENVERAILFLGGIIELSIGILGEYISRIYLESKHRPIFIVKDTNYSAAQSAPAGKSNVKEVKNNADKNKNSQHNQAEKTAAAEKSDMPSESSVEKNTAEKAAPDNIAENTDSTVTQTEQEPEKVEYDLSYFE